jgi:hypothetical protein
MRNLTTQEMELIAGGGYLASEGGDGGDSSAGWTMNLFQVDDWSFGGVFLMSDSSSGIGVYAQNGTYFGTMTFDQSGDANFHWEGDNGSSSFSIDASSDAGGSIQVNYEYDF